MCALHAHAHAGKRNLKAKNCPHLIDRESKRTKNRRKKASKWTLS